MGKTSWYAEWLFKFISRPLHRLKNGAVWRRPVFTESVSGYRRRMMAEIDARFNTGRPLVSRSDVAALYGDQSTP